MCQRARAPFANTLRRGENQTTQYGAVYLARGRFVQARDPLKGAVHGLEDAVRGREYIVCTRGCSDTNERLEALVYQTEAFFLKRDSVVYK